MLQKFCKFYSKLDNHNTWVNQKVRQYPFASHTESETYNQKKLLESLASFWIPKKIERLMKMTLEGAQGKVIVDGKISNPFVISRGVRQGDGLSATLFNLVLHKALKNLEQSNTILNRLTQICGYDDNILETLSQHATQYTLSP